MAATRLSDAQKQEIVGRYRQGETSAALAAAYGCSANTVSRVLKAALDPEDYERLKQQRGRRAGASAAAIEPDVAAAPAAVAVSVAVAVPVAAPEELPAADTAPLSAAAADPAPQVTAEPEALEPAGDAPDQEADDDDGPGVLAIDDADDFGDDDAEDAAEDDAEDGGDDDAAQGTAAEAAERELVQCQALSEAELPGSAYMLVDKVVELQPTALRDCTDLGPLPEEEADRQALQVYLNPRQAKRHCGRSQRVIKVPDLRVFQRTAPYLLAKGISRVVIEGSLYSLPGS